MIDLTKDQTARLHAIAASESIDAPFDEMIMTMVEEGISDPEDYITHMELCLALAEGMHTFAKRLRANGTSNDGILASVSFAAGFATGKLTAFDPIKLEDEARVVNFTASAFFEGFRNFAVPAPAAPKATHSGNETKN